MNNKPIILNLNRLRHTKLVKNYMMFSRIKLIVYIAAFGVIGIILFFALASPNPNLPGDLNGDNKVDGSDLTILLANYNTAYAGADINGDGTVNILDLSILLSHYGQTLNNPAPTVSISASPATISSGQSSTITWSSTNATSCTASGAWSGSKATSGSLSVSPTATATYSLSCTGAGGSTTASATVTVSSGGGGINSATWAPNSGAYVFERTNFGTSATDFQDFQSRETQLGGTYDGFMDYLTCNTGASELADARSAVQAGTPFVVLSWCTGNNPTTIIPSIASGSYDTDITNFANAVKSQLSGLANVHILIRPFWEFNYQGSEWDASNYSNDYTKFGQAFTRFENIFTNNSVPNVKWLLNTIRIGSSSADDPSPYYNAVIAAGGKVDWVGIDAYPKNKWISLPDLMTTSSSGFNWYSWASGLGKPLIVGETGIQNCGASSGYCASGQTRASWWQNAQSQLPSFPALKSVEYFDSQNGALDWRIDAPGPTNDTAASAWSAYSTWAKSNYFNPLGLR